MGKRSPRPNLLTDQLRELIDGCGMTRYRIAQETGVSESLLSLFMAGKRGLSMETLDTLGTFLNLELVRR